MKKDIRNSLVLGLALFAMFFGAGNMIFPPSLGQMAGEHWLAGFIAFIIADVGLASFALIVISKKGDGPSCITDVLGTFWSKLLLFTLVVCIGPLLSIPRTAAVTIEVGIGRLVPDLPAIVVSAGFFLIVALLSINPAKIVDIVGTALAPILFVTLMIMIIFGIMYPIGDIVPKLTLADTVNQGVISGYQTMDMMGIIIFCGIILTSIRQKGYTDRIHQVRMTAMTCVVAGFGLITVYGGLAYLGATASGMFEGYSQSELIFSIATEVMGPSGALLLSVIVTAACLTTAIGVLSSCADIISKMFNDRIGYKALVIGFSLFSTVITTVGLSRIISFSAPILGILYPIMVTLTILSAISGWIYTKQIYVLGTIGALTFGILDFIQPETLQALPLYDYGLGWLTFAVAGFLIACLSDYFYLVYRVKNNKAVVTKLQ